MQQFRQMFAGIIGHLGKIQARAERGQGARITVACPEALLAESEVGASIAVDGCCLTLAEKDSSLAGFDLAPETVGRTAPLAPGQRVHLEASLKAGDPIGGHLLFGHVDGTAQLLEREARGESLRLLLQAPAECASLIAEKGSVALAGVSLTVASCKGRTFAVELVPHTICATLLAQMRIGEAVNFEADMLARYAVRARRHN